MISNYKQLEVVRRQLGRAEDALVSLHEGVFHRNPRNYAVFAESYIDMILKLRAEIDAFLGIAPQPETPPEENGPNRQDDATPATASAAEPISR
jgi:hypothetical protein